MLIYESLALAGIAYLVLVGLRHWLAAKRGRLVFIAFELVVHGTWLLVHLGRAPLRTCLAWLAGAGVVVNLLCVVIGLPLLLSKEILQLARGLAGRKRACARSPDPSRRQFLSDVAIPTVALSLGGGGALLGAADFVVIRREIHIRNWPKELDGFRIGQITDTHVGDFIAPETVARAVDALNDANVHLQVMTGDLIDNLQYLEQTFEALERCRATYGMLTVLGNHEKMHHRLGPVLAAYARRRDRGIIRLLVDGSEAIKHNGAVLRVVGVDYPMHENGQHTLRRPERYSLMHESATVAFRHLRPTEETLVCLSHHPEFFPFAAKHDVRLTLSGHTHGGQVAIAGRPIVSAYDYMLGHYQLADSHLYVSGGTGHWFPVRYGVPTEVTIITLRSLGAAQFSRA